MVNLKEIQTKIDESIDSLDGIGRATPSPDLYAAITVRINNLENNFWGNTSNTISHPVTAFVSVFILLIINLFVIINDSLLFNSIASAPEFHTVDDLGINSFYQIENVQP